jgi:hypothetical protein
MITTRENMKNRIFIAINLPVEIKNKIIYDTKRIKK